MLGLNGKIARINLTNGIVKIEELDKAIIRKYLGGIGIAMRLFYDEVPPEVQPFDPENKLIFMIGALTSLIPSTTRHVIVGKSPLSGILGESYSGGYWAYELRKAGLDGLVIEGKAAKPVYIWVNKEQIQIREAGQFWELDAMETQTKIQEILDDNGVRVACIGQAGINLVRYACIMNERNAAGRCGLGAVMGSKMLKAIAVRGEKKINDLAVNLEELRELRKEASETLAKDMLVESIFGPLGTQGNMEVISVVGDVPHGYWKVGSWKGDKAFKGRKFKKTIASHDACYMCSVKCKKVCEIKDAEGNILFHGPGPEYETGAGFGTLLLNDNILSVFQANDLCNRYGLDTISCSEAIGFAMECWERNIITGRDTKGLELTWGNADAILKVIKQIALRNGIGSILAEGVDRAAKKFGKNSSKFAITVKGVEVPHHDPRAFHSMALTYATSSRGANHNDAFTIMLSSFPHPDYGFDEIIPRDSNDPELNAKAVIVMQNVLSVTNSLILCLLVAEALPFNLILKLLRATTGLELSREQIMTIGERIFNLKRMYAVRSGMSKLDDTLPNRLLSEPLPDGGAAGKLPDLENMLPVYYKLRGWSVDGVPTDETIKRLDLIVD